MGEEAGDRAVLAAPDLAAHAPKKRCERGGVVTGDERFMARALELARKAPHTSPNPRVGAVVVRDGRVLSEAFHVGAGTPHAEVLALRDVDARGATMYVNLEPCSHTGRTPPCAPALVSAGVSRVVAALEDPDERVRGRGLTILRQAGIEVATGVLAQDATDLNAAFIHHRSTGSAFLSLKVALTLDGKLAAADGSSRWITGENTRRLVHSRRLEADAVMVGSGTVIADDPRLTVRAVSAPRQPMRIVVDSAGRVPTSAAVFEEAGAIPVLMVTTRRCPHEVQIAWKEAGAEVSVQPERDESVDIASLLRDLGQRNVVEVFCEGGATLATSLLSQDLVGRLELHYGPKVLGSGVALGDLGVKSLDRARSWRVVDVQRSGDDFMVVAFPGSA